MSSIGRAEPTTVEIFVPPVVVFGLFALGIIIMVVAMRKGWKTSKFKSDGVTNKNLEILDLKDYISDDTNENTRSHRSRKCWDDKPMTPVSMSGTSTESFGGSDVFLTPFDEDVMRNLYNFYNCPLELIKICLPAAITMLLGPCFILFYYATLDFFWSKSAFPTRPNINQGIACFLTPAGLVYAITFGFAFQQALTKQHTVLTMLTKEISQLDQAATLASKLKLNSPEVRARIFESIKAEAIYMIMQVQNRETTDFKNKPTQDIKVEIWSVVELLRSVSGESRHYIDVVMSERIIQYISQMNNVCSDKMGILHSKIHPLKWLFLVALGFFSLFGVLLIQANSYRMELVMSTVTLLSVSMLCYIVGDLDSPFSGFFRIDISILIDVIHRLEMMHSMARSGCAETVCYPDSSKFRHKRKS